MHLTYKIAAVAALAAASSMPSFAQTATPAAAAASADLKVGTMVYGASGAEVGSIKRIDGDTIIVDTGTNDAALARSSFGASPKGPVIGFTKEQLDAAIAEAKAKMASQLDAKLVAGTAVTSADGAAIGTVKSLGDDGTVVLDDKGTAFALQKDLFTATDAGLALRITAAQLAEARGTGAAKN